MKKIIFNYNFCDMAPVCGGIDVCPVGAIYFDTQKQRPVWDESKCTFCLRCTMPDACPAGCILFGRDQREVEKIERDVKEDPAFRKALWSERYGVEPGKFGKKAEILKDDNFDRVISEQETVIIDVWSEDDMDCRVHSPLFSELLSPLMKLSVYKLDALAWPELANKLLVNVFPTLLVYKAGEEVFRHEKYISKKKVHELKKKING